MQGLFYYDPIPGDAEFYATDGQGRIRRTRLHIGFRTSWTKIVQGNFGGDGFTDLLFYDPSAGTGEFYRTDARGRIHLLQTHTGWRETWTHIIPGNFGGSGATDLLFYEAPTGTGEFYATDGQGGISLLQTHTGWRETWTQIIPGNFGGSGATDLLFYEAPTGTGEFWTSDGQGGISLLQTHTGWRESWSQILAGEFGTQGEHLRVHFKALIPITPAISTFMDTQYAEMARLFARNGVTVFRGADEDLSGNMALNALQNFDVGDCIGGETTQDHVDLFGSRNGAGANDLVVYVALTLIGGSGNFLGCAVHPDGQPGAVIVQSTAKWLTAHEVGHVLGLRHVCQFPSPDDPSPSDPCKAGDSDSLMFPNVGWTNVPPDISTAEEDTMRSSGLTRAW